MTSIDKINVLLIANGMSGAELCKAIGVSSGVYSQWNKKRNKVSRNNLKKIADLFHISVFDLLDDEEIEKTATSGDGKSDLEHLLEIIPTLSEKQAHEVLSFLLEKVSAPQIEDSH